MVCDQGLRPCKLSRHTSVAPVRGFCIKTSLAQPVKTVAATNITIFRRRLGVDLAGCRPKLAAR
jgi:hypothetical protein